MSNDEQSEMWNHGVGPAWVEHVDAFDESLAPFGRAVLDRLAVGPGERVMDIGCGAGGTTIALAGVAAQVDGFDLSDVMLGAARDRALAAGVDNVAFTSLDVQSGALRSDSYDVAFSRFGVMFFSDPIAAFTNIRSALVPGGRLGFVVFQGPIDNPFIVGPVMAAAAHVPVVLPADPTDPGPFSLADPARIRSILATAGFDAVTVDPGPAECVVGTADDLEGLARRALEQNPGVAPALAGATAPVRAAAIAAAAGAFAPHVVDGMVVMAAGTWVVTARR